MKTYIVIPCYNEETTIKKVIQELKKTGFNNIIIVNDCSTDNTKQILQKEQVTLLNHNINKGLGGSLRTGLKEALKQDAEITITIDGDGQMKLQDIIKIHKEMLKDLKTDLLIGSRFLKNHKMPLTRKIGNYGLNIITFILFGKYSTDSQSGLRAFSKKALQQINIQCNRMAVSSQIISESKKHNWNYKEVSITPVYTEHSLVHGQKWYNAFNIVKELIKYKVTMK